MTDGEKLLDAVMKHASVFTPRPSTESQVERIKRELQNVQPEYLRIYVISKAEEFENLRKQYDSQIDMLKAEVKRLGLAADTHNFNAVQAGKVNRDREWLNGLKDIPDLQVAVENGLVDIPKTVDLLKEQLTKTAHENSV